MPSEHPKLEALLTAAAAAGAKNRLGVVYPCSEDSLEAALKVRDLGIASVSLFGPIHRIEELAERGGQSLSDLTIHDTGDDPVQAANVAVRHCHADPMASREALTVLMKGSLHTDELLSAVLNKTHGLRTQHRLSHIFEFDIPGFQKSVFLADAVVNISPGLEDKKSILASALQAIRRRGINKPRVAIVAATESVNPKIPATLDAQTLVTLGREEYFGDAIIEGPMGLDMALSARAAHIKGVQSQVSGQVDLILAPDLNAGNMLFKSFIYAAQAECAGVVLGARIPIVLTSRADSAYSRVASCALAALISS
jgi:phosphate acetyltransferase